MNYQLVLQYSKYYLQLFCKDHLCTLFLVNVGVWSDFTYCICRLHQKNDFMAFLSCIASKYYIHCVSYITCQYLSRKSVRLVLAML